MGLDTIFGSTVEFLLHKTNGDPVALLRSIADYVHRVRPVSQRVTCSRECLLNAAADISFLQGKPQAHQCNRCLELQTNDRHRPLGGLRPSAEASTLIASEAMRSSFEIIVAPSTSDAHNEQKPPDCETSGSSSLTSNIPNSASDDFSFQVDNSIHPADRGSSSCCPEPSRTESQSRNMGPALAANQIKDHAPRVCFKDQDAVSSQEVPEGRPLAGASTSKPLVPHLHLKGLAASPRSVSAAVGAKTRKSNSRLIQSARGPRPDASSQQQLDSPKSSKHGNLSERGRPHTSGLDRERHSRPTADGSESEGSSPRKDQGVKELMTPDEHIKEWLAEKKRKEARRERHMRRRQLAELEFIAALRKTQARRLHHLHEAEGKLDLQIGSEAEVLFKKESAQARYRSLKGSV
ncbi:hypothetical protein KFL_006360050 [Klebsormidium nitens]|uniref:Uncharacterized protein n=1 Tax=Klebsormidium nitens TaxID=105231 RepID=A0A1Y1II76_KLENI|nr:hypothetical protein KFL_006360050 [Klebsormidium nitens]|eukprot:GAQ90413.1 hypothetical protein KFL_006360050 [Klebsormidium nitens]